MEFEGCHEIDLDFEAHDLIDNNQFSEAATLKKEVNISLGVDVNDHLPELQESTEPERGKRNGRYNLRKSLAWDSAFFTSAGVLDPEELSSMITGADKSEKPLLPGIEEEITGSTESLSTLESDHLTLEACEEDLFVDIRASIQRSSKEASNLTNSDSKTTDVEVDSTAISFLKKADSVPQDKNPKPGLRKTSGVQTVRTSKCQPKQIGKLAARKLIKPDSGHSQVASIAKIGERNPVLPKPPKTISSSIPTSTATAKRDSVGTGLVKSECGSSKLGIVSGKGTQPSKLSVLSGTTKPMPKPAVSSKSSLLGSSTTSRVHSTRSSTSSDSSTNLSSTIPVKSTLMTARRNLGKCDNNGIGPSSSISKTPSRAAPKNKLPASTLSAFMMSAKISSNVSPASSISEWSLASSSSSSMANQRSNNSRTSLDTSSCKSVDGDNILLDYYSAGLTEQRNENQRVVSTSSASKKSSTQAGSLRAPAKPSGLRMPSPKIGFFDGVKSPARTPNGHKQSESGLRTVFSKNGNATSNPIRGSNSKSKSAKVPTARMVTSLANIKPASPKVASPVPFPDKTQAIDKSSKSSSLSLGVECSATGETCQKAKKVQAEDGVKQVVDTGTGTIDKENSGAGAEHIKIASGEGSNSTSSEYVDQIGDNVLINQHLQKNSDSHSNCEAAEKEIDRAKCNGEGLREDKEGICQNVHWPTYGLVSDTYECALSFPAVDSESETCRAPFALKNLSCNNEGVDIPNQVADADKIGFVLPSPEQKGTSDMALNLV